MPPLMRAAVGAQTRALDAADRLRKVPAAKVKGARTKVTRELRNGMASVIEHVAIQPHSVADWKPLRGTPVVKSFLFEGKEKKAISALRMSSEQRQSYSNQVRAAAASRKAKGIGLGPQKKGPLSSKRPAQAADRYRNRGHEPRYKNYVNSAYEENAARDAAPPPPQKKSHYVAPKQMRYAAISAGVGVGALAAVHQDRRRDTAMSKVDRQVRDTALGAAGGAALGNAAYIAGGQGAKAGLRLHREKHWDNKKHNPIWEKHKQDMGVDRARGSTPHKVKQKMYEQYPKGLPGWRGQRLLALKNRHSVEGAVLTGAALVGAHHGHSVGGQNRGRTSVGKRLVEEQTRTRPSHQVAVAGGAGLVAWGTPRVKMLGEGLRIGARAAQDKKTRDFYRRAEGLRRAAVNGTQPADRLGRIPGVAALGRKIPKGIRPAAAVVGGVGLIRAGIPVSEKTYAPVTSW